MRARVRRSRSVNLSVGSLFGGSPTTLAVACALNVLNISRAKSGVNPSTGGGLALGLASTRPMGASAAARRADEEDVAGSASGTAIAHAPT